MKVRNMMIAAAAAIILQGCSQDIAVCPGKAFFKSFTYSGNDSIFSPGSLRQGEVFSTLLQGAYSDASICRKDSIYYMVTANYAFFPGIPVLRSKDLVNWEQVCYALPSEQQLLVSSLKASSQGLFPPSIRYCEQNGTFYITSTLVGGGGHFIIQAKDPAGPWSDPEWLQGIGGVHPSLFLDTDGKAYILNQGKPNYESPYSDYMVIWLQEFSLENLKPSGARRIILKGGDNPQQKPVWLETPHIFKKGKYYILTASEGGALGNGHASCAYRSQNVWGPYERCPHNPILTQRGLPAGQKGAITSTGRVDMVDTPDGQWWAVFQGIRPYSPENDYTQGRETFICPVSWDGGWPCLINGGEQVPGAISAPLGAAYDTLAGPFAKFIPHGNFTYSESFASDTLPMQWAMLRTPPEIPYEPNGGPGLVMPLSANNLRSQRHTGYIALRTMHCYFSAETEMHFEPESSSEFAGIALFLDDQHSYQMGVTMGSGNSPVIAVEKAVADGDAATKQEIAAQMLGSSFKGRVFLRARRSENGFEFQYKLCPGDEYATLASDVPARYLSLAQEGCGFYGLTVGLYASSEDN